MKKYWIINAVLCFLAMAVFWFLYTKSASPQILFSAGIASVCTALSLGVGLGRYFYLGHNVSDKDLKNDTLFQVDRVFFDGYVLMHQISNQGGHSKRKIVEISERFEFNRIRELFEKSDPVLILKRELPNSSNWLNATALSPKNASKLLDGYKIISIESPNTFVGPNGQLYHIETL